MTLYAFVKQSGEGCDYTIGCGQQLFKLEASTVEDAEKEIKESLRDGYGPHSDTQIADILILRLLAEVDVDEWLDGLEEEERQFRADAEREERRAQYLKLKEEFE